MTITNVNNFLHASATHFQKGVQAVGNYAQPVATWFESTVVGKALPVGTLAVVTKGVVGAIIGSVASKVALCVMPKFTESYLAIVPRTLAGSALLIGGVAAAYALGGIPAAISAVVFTAITVFFHVRKVRNENAVDKAAAEKAKAEQAAAAQAEEQKKAEAKLAADRVEAQKAANERRLAEQAAEVARERAKAAQEAEERAKAAQEQTEKDLANKAAAEQNARAKAVADQLAAEKAAAAKVLADKAAAEKAVVEKAAIEREIPELTAGIAGAKAQRDLINEQIATNSANAKALNKNRTPSKTAERSTLVQANANLRQDVTNLETTIRTDEARLEKLQKEHTKLTKFLAI